MENRQYPFYFKSTVILFGLTLLAYALVALRDILVPFSLAMILAILLNPIVNTFQRRGMGKVVSILFAMLLAFLVFGGILYFISSQVASFTESLPALKDKLYALLQQLQEWVHTKFGVSIVSQVQLVNEALNSSKALIGPTLGTAATTVLLILILPVYVFLLLFYKSLLLDFLYETFAEKNAVQVAAVLTQTKIAIQRFVIGLLIEALIMAILNSAALLILGVKYAVLLGVLGALLNLLPYIGGLLSTALPLLMATVTKDGFSTQLGIIIAYVVIQFFDNHFLIPKIVSSKVKINALVSMFAVLLGSALWGVAGMFLSIPFVAILKIICDRVDGLKAWGQIIGLRDIDKTATALVAEKQRKDLLYRRDPSPFRLIETACAGSNWEP